jgi:hypothetical protein
VKKLFKLYMEGTWEKKVLFSVAILALLPIAASLLLRPTPTPQSPSSRSERAQVDTFIPKGFVLVPIEVQNYEALDSILGKFGVVDLFQSLNGENTEQRLVARNVRILRAPQNPSHFAILVLEGEVHRVLKYGGTFNVIVKRPDNAGTEIVKGQERSHRSIFYERE